MDKIFHSTFDFFSHALPGACIAGAYYLISQDIESVTILFKTVGRAGIAIGIFLLMAGYVIGLAIYPIGRWLYQKFGKKRRIKEIRWDPNSNLTKEDEKYLPISDKFILIRELSPANFKYVETWHMFCAMCHNMAIACIIIFVMMIFTLDTDSRYGFFYANANWFLIMLVLMVLTALFINRAITFNIWAANDLNAAITRLKLVERAEKLPARPPEETSK